ncbi:hypothetical protein DL93DRAFT_2144731 [Clavulina sp. PMI_390]|nr:hypothetical protein DL93DRAFT_2144731 [Clavulina sp. PMI_390]
MCKGMIEADSESENWDGWDEDCHGPRDTEQSQNEYPSCFKWSCYGTGQFSMCYSYDKKTGKEIERDGCRVGQHQARGGGSKK